MLVAVASLLALLSPVIAGRWPAGVLLHRWRWPVLVWAAVAAQLAVITMELPGALAPILHVLTYAAAVAFLWLNRRVVGAWVVAAGALLNGIVIALNGGTLPASASAVAAAGLDHDAAFANSAVLEHPVLLWLGDVFAWPAPLPLANTFSVGDVVIAVGVGVVAWKGSRRFGEAARSPHAGGSETPLAG